MTKDAQVPTRNAADTDLQAALARLQPAKGTVVLVADSGGHLQEMWEQAKLLAPELERHWISSDTQMSQSLLASEPSKQLLPTRIFPRRLDLALRAIPSSVRELRRLKPQAVISTGPAIAVPWLMAARLLRIPALFIESATFVKHRSMSGKISNFLPGVQRFSQTALLKGRWKSAPNVFDLIQESLESAPHEERKHQVFVTVGSNRFPFDRLVRRIESIVPCDWDIVWQLSGDDHYKPERGTVLGLVPLEEMHQLIRESAVVVCHAGVGSALTALELGRIPIVCARAAAHNEHVDDHQSDLTGYLAPLPIVLVRDADELSFADLVAAAAR